MDLSLLLITLFVIKHFFCDFIWQGSYQFLNKGKYGHPGGLLHIGIHAFGSLKVITVVWLISFFFIGIDFQLDFVIILFAFLFEAIVHYHVDYFKVKITSKFGWEPNTHTQFWYLLGADQFIHYMTYIAMVWMLV